MTMSAGAGAAPATADLSSNDATVLSHLFDPDATPAGATAAAAPLIDPSLPADAHITDTALLQTLKATELRAVKLAESGDLSQARDVLEALNREHPTYASAYNNLAQVLRMLSSPPETVLAALDTAISLAAPAADGARVSEAAGRLLAKAYTQRAAVVYMAWKKGGVLRGMEGGEMESRASRDFWEGGRYGSEVGREMAVRTNPYARLCGEIVKEALTREYVGGGV